MFRNQEICCDGNRSSAFGQPLRVFCFLPVLGAIRWLHIVISKHPDFNKLFLLKKLWLTTKRFSLVAMFSFFGLFRKMYM